MSSLYGPAMTIPSLIAIDAPPGNASIDSPLPQIITVTAKVISLVCVPLVWAAPWPSLSCLLTRGEHLAVARTSLSHGDGHLRQALRVRCPDVPPLCAILVSLGQHSYVTSLPDTLSLPIRQGTPAVIPPMWGLASFESIRFYSRPLLSEFVG